MFEGTTKVGCLQYCDGPQVGYGFPIEAIGCPRKSGSLPLDEGGFPQRGLGWLLDG